MTMYGDCPHLENVLQLSLSDLSKSKQGQSCAKCDTCGPNLWICLFKNCMQIGCSEKYNDHNTKHYKNNPIHCVHMNLSSQRLWCYNCEKEVFLAGFRRSSLVSNDSSDTGQYTNERTAIFDRNTNVYGGNNVGGESCDSSGDDDDGASGDRNYFGNGLVGLQNIANTCYMNAALQALSNTPPLTGYFLDCGDVIEATNEFTQMSNSNQRKTGLARSFHRLVKDMWCRSHRSNGYIVPAGILNGIRNVHPMFRGYQQHDTQEFLRCFMDQLHEELKEVTPPPPDVLFQMTTDNEDNHSECSTSSISQSEVEYETCDSNISEQSSLSGDIPINTYQTYMPSQTNHIQQRYSRSPSPTLTTNQSYSMKFNNNNYQQQTLSSSCSNSVTSISSGGNTNTKSSTNDITTVSVKPPPHRSIISDVFDGKLLSSVQCLTCDRISTRTETFQDLSLPIPGKDHLTVLHQTQNISLQQHQQQQQQQQAGVTCTDAVYQATQLGWFATIANWVRSFLYGPAVTLHDCMGAFFSADELKGDNMYSCEKCNKLRNGIKFSRVLELPEMLCVHLKRFRHDLSYSSKITSTVNFPLKGLDMSTYVHKDCKSLVHTYDLTAVICHHGTVGGGHYTSFAKHQPSNKWYEYDDQLVTEVTEEMVQSCEAYVLFYRKSNQQMTKIREQAVQLVEVRGEHTATDINFFVSKQWLNKFSTFAEPGPIDNWALLCPHGALAPNKAKIKSQLVVPLPQPMWDFLYQKFGGGPACNHLYECDICYRAAEALARRQAAELDAFQVYKDEMSTVIYAISMTWLRQWQQFVAGGSVDEPGPINNSTIAGQIENGLCRSVKPGSDYAQITLSLWKFFYSIYGGGPEIILRGIPPSDEIKQPPIKRDIIANGDDVCSVSDTEISTTTTTTAKRSVIVTDDSERLVDKRDSVVENGIGVIQQSQVSLPQSQQSQQQPQQQKKIVKNVSFENDEKETTPIIIAADVPIQHLKRTKQHQPNVVAAKNSNNSVPFAQTNEIVSKRDKRHHGDTTTTNGLFGPDGTYSDYKHYNNIPDEIQNTYPSNNQQNNVSDSYENNLLPNTNNGDSIKCTKGNTNLTSMVKENSTSTPVKATTTTTSANFRKTHHNNKNAYRKKLKIKQNRKFSSSINTNNINNIDGGSLSDSDRS